MRRLTDTGRDPIRRHVTQHKERDFSAATRRDPVRRAHGGVPRQRLDDHGPRRSADTIFGCDVHVVHADERVAYDLRELFRDSVL
jgi:hypothetical protein